MKRLSNEVKEDIEGLLVSFRGNVDTPLKINGECTCGCLREDECECRAMCLTVACNDHGTKWDYQTGDNSYTGGAYGLPNWAVTWIPEEFDVSETLDDIVNDLEDLLPENR